MKKRMSTVDVARPLIIPADQFVMLFLMRAHRQHRFGGTGTQCRVCWGWYDDPRHV